MNRDQWDDQKRKVTTVQSGWRYIAIALHLLLGSARGSIVLGNNARARDQQSPRRRARSTIVRECCVPNQY